VTVREKLIKAMQSCSHTALGDDEADRLLDAYAHELREQWGKEANVILCQALDEHAHDLAEKIRLLPGDPWDEDEMWAQGCDAAADVIDPETAGERRPAA
jgi:hypothetical protein